MRKEFLVEYYTHMGPTGAWVSAEARYPFTALGRARMATDWPGVHPGRSWRTTDEYCATGEWWFGGSTHALTCAGRYAVAGEEYAVSVVATGPDGVERRLRSGRLPALDPSLVRRTETFSPPPPPDNAMTLGQAASAK